jgi:hypothetical protein
MGIELGYYGWLTGGMSMSEHEVDPAFWFVAFTVVLTRLHHQGGLSKLSLTDSTPAFPAQRMRAGHMVGHSGAGGVALIGKRGEFDNRLPLPGAQALS